tara:strand:+ start:247 stop:762 length:516 start_codon:yes stop_codon:yes gene_type:complete
MPNSLSPSKQADIQALQETGHTHKQTRAITGLSWSTISKYRDQDRERFTALVEEKKRAWVLENHVIAGMTREKIIESLPDLAIKDASDARNIATVGGIATDKILAAEGLGKASQPASLQMFNSSITVNQEVTLSPSEVNHLVDQADRREAGERTRSDALDAESVSGEGIDS